MVFERGNFSERTYTIAFCSVLSMLQMICGGCSRDSHNGDAKLAPAILTVSVAAPQAKSHPSAPPKDTRTSCPDDMVRVPGGTFGQRRADLLNENRAASAIPLDWDLSVRTLCIGRTEVTVASFAQCVAQGACTIPKNVPEEGTLCNWDAPKREAHPINCVDFRQAADYCKYRGGRLPTEWEWEWAARGRDNATKYPWGNEPPMDQVCWSGVNPHMGTCIVSSFPKGNSVDGIADLTGNVDEWTTSTRPISSTITEPGYVARGNSWRGDDPRWLRVDVETVPLSGHTVNASLGFRCVADIAQ
jgi:formylglycine-generating enzyme